MPAPDNFTIVYPEPRLENQHQSLCRFKIECFRDWITITPLATPNSGHCHPWRGRIEGYISVEQARALIKEHFYSAPTRSFRFVYLEPHNRPIRFDLEPIRYDPLPACEFEITQYPGEIEIKALGSPSSGLQGTRRVPYFASTINVQQAGRLVKDAFYPEPQSDSMIRHIEIDYNEPILENRIPTICRFRVNFYPIDHHVQITPVGTPNSGVVDDWAGDYSSDNLSYEQALGLIKEHYYPSGVDDLAITYDPYGNVEYTLEYREPTGPDGRVATCQFKLHFYPHLQQVLIHPLNHPNSGIIDTYVASHPYDTLSLDQVRELIKVHYYPSETQSESRIHRQGEMSYPNRRRRWLTFMPYSSFQKTARCLADRDLKLMRSVSLRVLWYLANNIIPRRRAAEMWRGHEQALARYGMAIARELRRRGFKDTSLDRWRALRVKGAYKKPQWVFWSRLRETHKQYLVLQGFRYTVAKACHVYNRAVPNDIIGLRRVLRFFDCVSLRNSDADTLLHVWNNLERSPTAIGLFQSHYTQFNWELPAKEDFVYPEPERA